MRWILLFFSIQPCFCEYYIDTVAGSGAAGYNGDGGHATDFMAWLKNPAGVAVDVFGNVFIADAGNNRIRKVDTGNVLSTFAGNGDQVNLFYGDGVSATNAALNYPTDVAVDIARNVYIADTNNHCIRKVDDSNLITTFAGTPQVHGYDGDGLVATSATLYFPSGVAVDVVGNLFIADSANNVIRKVDTFNIITTFAGTGTAGYSGDNGLATFATLKYPQGLAVGNGDLYIADFGNGYIRKIDSSSVISSVVRCDSPIGIDVDSSGNVFFGDAGMATVYVVDTTASVVKLISGTGSKGFGGDGGPAVSAKLDFTGGLSVNAAGNVYIADTNNNRIRVLTTTQPSSTPSATPYGRSSVPSVVPTTILLPTSNHAAAPKPKPKPVPRINHEPTNLPTGEPSSEPSGEPSAEPSGEPSAEPTVKNTDRPSTEPSSYPTGQPSTAPSIQHSCLTVHMVDLFGDGWGPYIKMIVDIDGEISTFSLTCSCNTVVMCFQSYMNISIQSTVVPAVHSWEVLWSVEFNGKEVFGDFDTSMIFNYLNVTAGEISTHDEVDVLRYHKVDQCHRCHHPHPKPSPLNMHNESSLQHNESSLQHNESSLQQNESKSDSHGPPPPVHLPIKLVSKHHHGWYPHHPEFSDICPNVTKYPTLLTYPKYYIISKDRTEVLHTGTLCGESLSSEICEEILPPKGSYIWRVAGFETVHGESTWEFCGVKGGVGEELLFEIKAGKCIAGLKFNASDYCGGIATLSKLSGSFTLLNWKEILTSKELSHLERDLATVLHAEYISITAVTVVGKDCEVVFTGIVEMERVGYHGLLGEAEEFLTFETSELAEALSNGKFLAYSKIEADVVFNVINVNDVSYVLMGNVENAVLSDKASVVSAPVDIVIKADTPTQSQILSGASNLLTLSGFAVVCVALFAGVAKAFRASNRHIYVAAMDASSLSQDEESNTQEISRIPQWQRFRNLRGGAARPGVRM